MKRQSTPCAGAGSRDVTIVNVLGKASTPETPRPGCASVHKKCFSDSCWRVPKRPCASSRYGVSGRGSVDDGGVSAGEGLRRRTVG